MMSALEGREEGRTAKKEFEGTGCRRHWMAFQRFNKQCLREEITEI